MQSVISLNKQELRIVIVLASIFSLRMLGLFMLLPVFAIEATKYEGATEQLVGLTIGSYGLMQALFQLPFGMLSDRYGRKPVILAGLAIFMLGSLIAAKASGIYGLMLGRSLQGCAAIGSVVIASLADHTREEVRASSMAILGISIALSFMLALGLGSWLSNLAGLTGVFWFSAALALGGMLLLLLTIPKSAAWQPMGEMASFKQNLLVVLRDRRLLVLGFGVFALHASLAALFLVLPLLLKQAGFVQVKLAPLYLVVLVVAMLFALKIIGISERRQKINQAQMLAILSLGLAQAVWFFNQHAGTMVATLIIYFTAFCVLESSLPTLVAKYAPVNNRGAALGIYSSLQFLGVFAGGSMGGWLHGRLGIMAVLGLCVILAAMWLSSSMKLIEERG